MPCRPCRTCARHAGRGDRLGRRGRLRAAGAPLRRRAARDRGRPATLAQGAAGAATRAEWRGLPRAAAARSRYDAVIDLQGLTKSALVPARAAGARRRRYAMANRTEGSSYEPADALARRRGRSASSRACMRSTRSRELCARALGLRGCPASCATGCARTRVAGEAARRSAVRSPSCTAPRAPTRCWPEAHWIELGRRLVAQGLRVALPHGDQPELERAQRLAQALGPGRAGVAARRPRRR